MFHIEKKTLKKIIKLKLIDQTLSHDRTLIAVLWMGDFTHGQHAQLKGGYSKEKRRTDNRK